MLSTRKTEATLPVRESLTDHSLPELIELTIKNYDICKEELLSFETSESLEAKEKLTEVAEELSCPMLVVGSLNHGMYQDGSDIDVFLLPSSSSQLWNISSQVDMLGKMHSLAISPLTPIMSLDYLLLPNQEDRNRFQRLRFRCASKLAYQIVPDSCKEKFERVFSSDLPPLETLFSREELFFPYFLSRSYDKYLERLGERGITPSERLSQAIEDVLIYAGAVNDELQREKLISTETKRNSFWRGMAQMF